MFYPLPFVEYNIRSTEQLAGKAAAAQRHIVCTDAYFNGLLRTNLICLAQSLWAGLVSTASIGGLVRTIGKNNGQPLNHRNNREMCKAELENIIRPFFFNPTPPNTLDQASTQRRPDQGQRMGIFSSRLAHQDASTSCARSLHTFFVQHL